MSNESDKELYTAFEHGAESRESEIESLRQRLILKEHQYDVMKASAEVLAEQCDKMRQQLAASQKREVTLRKLIGEIYCSDDSSAEVTRKIEGVLNALGNSYRQDALETVLATTPNEALQAFAAKVREQCAVAAWLHYMEVCKKHGHGPDVQSLRDFCSATAIRNMIAQVPE